jgi:ACR3 family arsenite efflux pump ArsB
MEQMAMFEFLNISKALAEENRLHITLVWLLFSFKGEVIIGNPLTILWIAMAVQQPTTG